MKNITQNHKGKTLNRYRSSLKQKQSFSLFYYYYRTTSIVIIVIRWTGGVVLAQAISPIDTRFSVAWSVCLSSVVCPIRQGCRGYGDSHGDSHGYGYGMGMGTVMNPHGFCG